MSSPFGRVKRIDTHVAVSMYRSSVISDLCQCSKCLTSGGTMNVEDNQDGERKGGYKMLQPLCSRGVGIYLRSFSSPALSFCPCPVFLPTPSTCLMRSHVDNWVGNDEVGDPIMRVGLTHAQFWTLDEQVISLSRSRRAGLQSHVIVFERTGGV